MEKIITYIAFFLVLGNTGFCQKKKNFKEVSYHSLSDSSIAIEVLTKWGMQKIYSYRKKNDTSVILFNNRADWEELAVVHEPDCKLVYFPNQQDIFPHKSIILHYQLVNSESQLVCKYVEDYKKSGTILLINFKKWHSNGQLAYKEQNTTKGIYHYKRYNKEGQLIAKWRRDFSKVVNRLDGWATIWHKDKKQKLYKLYFEQDRVIQFVKYDHRGRVALKANYNKEDDKLMYDLLSRYEFELLHIEQDCKSICFPQTLEVIKGAVYKKKGDK